jgi:IS30 family transposase
VERKSKLTRLAKVTKRLAKVTEKSAELVAQAITGNLQPLVVKSIASDNGRELADHQQIGKS